VFITTFVLVWLRSTKISYKPDVAYEFKDYVTYLDGFMEALNSQTRKQEADTILIRAIK